MGKKALDLTGQKFTKLTVLEFDYDKYKETGKKYWKCKCDCGNLEIKSVTEYDLIHENVKACGCLRGSNVSNFIDMIGQKIGKITIIRLDHMHEKAGAFWECLCDCGNPKTFVVSGNSIRQGHTKSCGCLHKDAYIRNRDNLLGQKFNHLTVFDFEINESHNVIWLCECDCGSQKIVKCKGIYLKNGKTKSCGCLRARRLPFGENAFNRLYGTYKKKAEDRGFEFEFTKDEFKEITQKPCFYCGREPFQKAPPTLSVAAHGFYVYNGVDRVDNSIGYTKENSVPCCGQCNVSKNNYDEQDFINWIELVYINLKNKGVIKN
jgi:hypothetical protein